MVRRIDIRYLVAHAILSVTAYAVLMYALPIDHRWFLLIAPTLSAIFLMSFDKFAALQGWGRVPERGFMFIAFLGGSIGVLIGMQLFRHKTSKMSFQFALTLVCLSQIALVLWWVQK